MGRSHPCSARDGVYRRGETGGKRSDASSLTQTAASDKVTADRPDIFANDPRAGGVKDIVELRLMDAVMDACSDAMLAEEDDRLPASRLLLLMLCMQLKLRVFSNAVALIRPASVDTCI